MRRPRWEIYKHGPRKAFWILRLDLGWLDYYQVWEFAFGFMGYGVLVHYWPKKSNSTNCGISQRMKP